MDVFLAAKNEYARHLEAMKPQPPRVISDEDILSTNTGMEKGSNGSFKLSGQMGGLVCRLCRGTIHFKNFKGHRMVCNEALRDQTTNSLGSRNFSVPIFDKTSVRSSAISMTSSGTAVSTCEACAICHQSYSEGVMPLHKKRCIQQMLRKLGSMV